MAKGTWDLTSESALQAAADWLRKKAGDSALIVAIVRVDDLAISAHPALAPREAEGLLADRMTELHKRLTEERTQRQGVAERRQAREEKRRA